MITPAQFNVFVSTVNTLMGQAWIDTNDTIYDKIAIQIPSKSTQEGYAWTGMLQKMRLWEGPRVTQEAAPQTYFLINQPFESTLALDRFRLDDDQFGVYYRQLPDMARQAKRQPDYMLRDLLENTGDQTGTRQFGIDGLTAFNTSHPVDLYNPAAGTYSNDFTGGGATVQYPNPAGGHYNILTGGSLNVTSVFTLSEYMRTLQGEDQETLGLIPNLIMIAPQLMGEAELVLKMSFSAPPSWGSITGQVGAAENAVKRFGIDYVMNPYLHQAYTWYMMDTNRGFRPFIHQIREAVRMVPRVNENDPVVFDSHEYLWGQWLRGAVGWGPSWLFMRSGP